MKHNRYAVLGALVATIIGCLTTCSSAADNPACPLRYSLSDHHIDHWLVAGPRAVRIAEVHPFQGKDDDATKRNILNHYYQAESEVKELPCEGKAAVIDGATFPWRCYRCEEDHAVAFGQGGGCVYFKTWAYAQVDCPLSYAGQWKVAVHGPVDVWVNGQHVLRKDDVSIFVPVKHDFAANLKSRDQ